MMKRTCELLYRLFKPAPTKVRGGRGSTRKSHSAKRIAEMFPDAETVVEYRNRYDNDQRPIERLPQAQTTNNLIWVSDKNLTYHTNS